jgi:hypothetical protein
MIVNVNFSIRRGQSKFTCHETQLRRLRRRTRPERSRRRRLNHLGLVNTFGDEFQASGRDAVPDPVRTRC